jgi:hypothetical protein
MSLHPHFVIKRELEDRLRTVKDETFAIYQLLVVAQNATQAASVAYFALTPSSDNRETTLASTAYNTAIIEEEPIRLSFNAKVAELQAVKDALQAEEENWKE